MQTNVGRVEHSLSTKENEDIIRGKNLKQTVIFEAWIRVIIKFKSFTFLKYAYMHTHDCLKEIEIYII